MASLVSFTLVVASVLSVSVKGQTDQYFTHSAPADYYQRVSLNDCPLRFYPNSNRFLMEIPPPAFGGQNARIGEFQHMVRESFKYQYLPVMGDNLWLAIRFNDDVFQSFNSLQAAIGWTTNGKTEYLCGGTLISSKFVLTAAHCAVNGDNIAPNTVRLGDTNLADVQDDLTAQQINIRAFKKHPLYRPSRKYYDIALIELESEVRFDDATCSACLWLEKEVPPEEMEAIGFGALGYGASLSPILQKVKLSAIDKKSCDERLPVSRRALPDGFVDEQFCAGSDHMDTCEGDSGGPIQIERADVDGTKIPLVVGIVSFGAPCTHGSLGVYTRVASYREWIEQEIQQPVDYLTCTRMKSCPSSKHSYSGTEPTYDRPIFRVGLLWNSSESNSFQCGATLIDYRFALTSAYCTQKKRSPPKYIVVDSTGEMVEIDRVIIHPQFKAGRHANDIALLKLAKHLNPDNNLLPACLLVGNEENSKSGDSWHYSAYSTRYARNGHFRKDDYEQYTINPYISCTNPEHKQENITCRKNPINLIPTVCNIDHGGPVYTKSLGDPIPYLHGLVSDLSEGCSGNLITIRVSPHIEWIERIVLDHTDERMLFQ